MNSRVFFNNLERTIANVLNYLSFIAITLIALFGLATILVSILLGRPIGDDLSAIVFYSPEVVVSHAINEIQNTGRFGQSLLSSITYSLTGSRVGQIGPFVAVFGWLGLTYVYVKLAFSRYQINPSRSVVLSVAGLVFFLVAFTNANPTNVRLPVWFTFQNFLWPAAIITYTLPLGMYLTVVYLFLLRKPPIRKRYNLIFYSILTYLLCLTNETMPATLAGLSVLGLVSSYLPYLGSMKNHRSSFIVTGISTSLAFVSLIFSKGSQERQATTGVSTRDSIWENLKANLGGYFLDWGYRPIDFILLLLAAVVISLVVNALIEDSAKFTEKKLVTGIIFSLLAITGSIVSMTISLILPAVGYGEWVPPLTRLMLIPQVLHVVGFLVLFTNILLIARIRLHRIWITLITATVMVSLLFYGSQILQKLTSQVKTSASYANTWDEYVPIIEKKVRENPNETILLPREMDGIGNDFLLSCVEGNWLHVAMQRYFNATRICSIEDSPEVVLDDSKH